MHVVSLKPTGAASHLLLIVIQPKIIIELCVHSVTVTTDPSVRSVSPAIVSFRMHQVCTVLASVCNCYWASDRKLFFSPFQAVFQGGTYSTYVRTFQCPCCWSCGHSSSALLSDLFTQSRSWVTQWCPESAAALAFAHTPTTCSITGHSPLHYSTLVNRKLGHPSLKHEQALRYC